MKGLLATEEFQTMERFIVANVIADAEGLEDKFMETESNEERRQWKKLASAYNRPPDPRKQHTMKKCTSCS